jgi:hypothetical protein
VFARLQAEVGGAAFEAAKAGVRVVLRPHEIPECESNSETDDEDATAAAAISTTTTTAGGRGDNGGIEDMTMMLSRAKHDRMVARIIGAHVNDVHALKVQLGAVATEFVGQKHVCDNPLPPRFFFPSSKRSHKYTIPIK